ncbi:hypothetical protein CW751_08280 [Brumimicrobium salinarum]|uniref:Secretion system C-terminal sorting domain-containing protein n=1 Tax=Brumimicrobium salinarum TaxID=2058658 RepID=A0A2I0R2E8_9FLAO|nr:T9SS type A sorting domain-containing protein [Brumimicrobium salinarum]PKR80758.1 hypothetical protein CW751_08280 [Brumimicrobium salinarum]
MIKKLLTVSTILLSSISIAQFNPSNAPQVKDSIFLYLVDSSAQNYASVTGTGVTWDYSNLIDYNEEQRLIDVKTVADTPYETTFTASDKAIEVEGQLVTFITDDQIERNSQGVVYKDAQNGDLILNLDTDEGKYYSYPFDVGDEISDSIKGTATMTINSTEQTVPARGLITTKVDGKGTLKMGAMGEYENVIRYFITDTIVIETGLLGDWIAIHTQYEYYDHTVSNLPIFTHSYLMFGRDGAPEPRTEYNVVMSKDIMTTSIDQEALEAAKLYPNPVSNLMNIILPNEVKTADLVVYDGMGRAVKTSTINGKTNTLDVSDLENGIYHVKIQSGAALITKSIIVE